MSLQLGRALSEGATQLVSRTGAMLLGTYAVLIGTILPLSNTMFVRLYERAGLTTAAEALPLALDVSLSVAVAGYLGVALASTYVSVVAIRTFVAGARESFPDGAFTRNVPLAIVNVVVGGVAYSVLVTLGTLALVVPGIIAYVAFVFMVPYIAVEDRNFVAALRESYRLSKGHWLLLFALVVIVVAAASVVGGVGGLAAALLLPPAAGQLALVLVQAPVSVYVLAVIAAAFNQLRGDAEPSESTPNADTPSTPV